MTPTSGWPPRDLSGLRLDVVLDEQTKREFDLVVLTSDSDEGIETWDSVDESVSVSTADELIFLICRSDCAKVCGRDLIGCSRESVRDLLGPPDSRLTILHEAEEDGEVWQWTYDFDGGMIEVAFRDDDHVIWVTLISNVSD